MKTERTNIYLKISCGNSKKIVFVLRTLVYCPLMSALVCSSDSNNCGVLVSVAQFDQNLRTNNSSSI